MELFITYTYTDEGKFTENYKAFAGQSANEIASASAFNNSFDLFFPDDDTPPGKKTLRSSWLKANFIDGDSKVNQEPTTTMNVNSASGASQTFTHRTNTENYQGTALYEFDQQIGVSSTAATANYMLTGDPFNVAGIASIVYECLPVPSSSTALGQYAQDGITAIPSGGWINNQAMRLQFTMKGKFPGDTLYPVVEVKPMNGIFDGTILSTGASQIFNGTALAADLLISTGPGQYQWRASVFGNGGRSGWSTFTTAGTRHFGIDVDSPAAPVPSTPADVSCTNDQTPVFSWSVPAETGGSGLKDYTLQISTGTAFATLSYSTQITATSFELPASLPQTTDT
jgi:hypothetical protein